MKIAIVGAGGAGLCAARHCLQENYVVDVFEQTSEIGGTWTYTDLVGQDENGIPIHSSMYKGLRTNLPKELMVLEDFPHKPQERSYLHQQEVLDYIKSYAEKFQLIPHIKFLKQIVLVEPLDDGLWLVEYQDVTNKKKESGHYDAVIICNGHYKDPFIPELSGKGGFKGGMKHSHDYRTPDCYQNKRVLVIGAGPSGTDISKQIVSVATEVYLSHKSEKLPLPDSICQKPVITRLEGDRAFFEDGTVAEIDDILFCTGYNYSFPFLSDKCGVKVEENLVFPLYKHIISVENPTLAFLGIPFIVCPFPMFDLQVRFFLSTLNGHFELPPKKLMLRELEEEMESKKEVPKNKFHLMGDAQGDYFEDLAKTAGIKGVPPVIHKLYMRVKAKGFGRNLNDCFRIVDEDNWEQVR